MMLRNEIIEALPKNMVLGLSDSRTPIFFQGLDLSMADGMRFEEKIAALAERGVNRSFLYGYGEAVISLIDRLPRDYRGLLKETNGLRTNMNDLSLVGIPMESHSIDIFVPTSIFTMNLLERQLERRTNEIYLGYISSTTSRLFLCLDTGKVYVRGGGREITFANVGNVISGICD